MEGVFRVELIPIDLCEIPLNIIKIQLCQIEIPDNYFEINFKIKKEYILDLKEKIFNYLNKSIQLDAKFVIFPELVLPYELLNEIIEFALQNNKYIIIGMEYKNDKNSCKLITDSGKIFTQDKVYASKDEKGHMILGKNINLYINTPIGDFATIICYDFTNIGIISSLCGFIDIIFVISRNPALLEYEYKARAISYYNYCCTLICNQAGKLKSRPMGSSAVYLPKYVYRDENNMIHDNMQIFQLGINEDYDTFEFSLDQLRNITENRQIIRPFLDLPAGYSRNRLRSRYKVEHPKINEYFQFYLMSTILSVNKNQLGIADYFMELIDKKIKNQNDYLKFLKCFKFFVHLDQLNKQESEFWFSYLVKISKKYRIDDFLNFLNIAINKFGDDIKNLPFIQEKLKYLLINQDFEKFQEFIDSLQLFNIAYTNKIKFFKDLLNLSMDFNLSKRKIFEDQYSDILKKDFELEDLFKTNIQKLVDWYTKSNKLVKKY